MHRQKRRDGWYRKKTYPHFDYPLAFEQAERIVSSSARVTRHQDLPFIGYQDVQRRFKPSSPEKYKNKKRDIRYCSHVSGYIHSYYAVDLNEKYEQFIRSNEIANNVIGYRSSIGTNVDMAKAAFDEIRRRRRCEVLAIDITDFFPSIDHAELLNKLKVVLGVDRLPEDWFSIYRAMTKFAWVQIDELIEHLSLDKNDLPKPLCSIADFRAARQAGLVHTNKSNHGIPQGSPLSAIFSNIAMIEFDRAIAEFARQTGSYYRRYSDDIIFICRSGLANQCYDVIKRQISVAGNALVISDEKTERSRFSVDASGSVVCDTPVSYLGFTFDGERTLIRGKSLSRYYRRLTYATRQVARAARENPQDGRPFRRKLYKQFSHLGQSNFYTYVKKAAVTLDDESPRKQLKRHMRVLGRKLNNRGK